MSHNYYSLHNFVDHKIVYQITLIDFWSHLVAFSAHYLNTPLSNNNQLIDRSFNSHQEYTIVTSLLVPPPRHEKRPHSWRSLGSVDSIRVEVMWGLARLAIQHVDNQPIQERGVLTPLKNQTG